MKDSIAQLPPEKQAELLLAVDIIRKKCEGVQMIILFGSYARGKAVEHIRTEGHMTVEYKSDFEILVITEKKKQADDLGMQNSVEDTCFEHKKIDTTVAPIYHHIAFINKRLSQGQYFFSDIKEFGIMLYDTGKHKFAEKKDSHKKISTIGSKKQTVLIVGMKCISKKVIMTGRLLCFTRPQNVVMPPSS